MDLDTGNVVFTHKNDDLKNLQTWRFKGIDDERKFYLSRTFFANISTCYCMTDAP